jgi:hypothetical protein
MHFTHTKLDSVVNFAEPTTLFGVKQFLGFANNFQDHVKCFSILAIPLQELVKCYTKSMKLRKCGSRVESATFNRLEDLIDKFQMLFYFDVQPGDKMQLKTDASNYGIGAYLYIVQNGRKIPIRYLSKSPASAQLNWSTPQKECFAVLHALQ